VNILLIETMLSSGQTLQLLQGDITIEKTDAIVNAANPYLRHGAGVAGAILHRGGPIVQQESDEWVQMHGPVSHSEPAWTSGGNLPSRFVIHAVGPVWRGAQSTGASAQSTGEGKDAELAAAVNGSLRVADKLGLVSIALPAISTGIFGFPEERAAGVFYESIQRYFERPSSLRLVRLVLHETSTVTAFEKIWHDHFSPKP
jgi:O-acetyl-ADP-ribose deacetylase (regulator of RNase III)